MTASVPQPVARVDCPLCGASCLVAETVCWKCGAGLEHQEERCSGSELIDFAEAAQEARGKRQEARGEGQEHQAVVPRTPRPERPRFTLTGEPVAEPAEEAVVEEDFAAPTPPAASPPSAPPPESPPKRLATTLTGEVVEIPDFSVSTARILPEPSSGAVSDRSATAAPPTTEPDKPIMRITFCKTCGIQNEETATECRKCRQPLEIITEPLPDIKPVGRSWGFDLLGVAWIALGLAAAYCGRFIVKADPAHPGITWADYFWTGVVVCAPGLLIFMRHYFCRFMFWAMTFASVLIWGVIGFIWLYIGLHVTDNGRVGLLWFAALSGLSFISYLTVRLNDEFDVGS